MQDPEGRPLVVKVGGSLLRRAADYAAVAKALQPLLARPLWVVVSAAKGATDALEQVAKGREDAHSVLAWHTALAEPALDTPILDGYARAQAALQAGDPQPLLAWGEQASAALLQRHLARLGHHVPVVELAPAQPPPPTPHAVVPGFYLRGPDGRVQVLPRGGSDISAVLAAQWLGARHVHLWKEGGGIRLEPGVVVEKVDAPTLLAWLGNRVRPIHPDAVRLASEGGITLTLSDPWGLDGSTCIDASTEGLIPSLPVAHRVAGEAAL